MVNDLEVCSCRANTIKDTIVFLTTAPRQAIEESVRHFHQSADRIVRPAITALEFINRGHCESGFFDSKDAASLSGASASGYSVQSAVRSFHERIGSSVQIAGRGTGCAEQVAEAVVAAIGVDGKHAGRTHAVDAAVAGEQRLGDGTTGVLRLSGEMVNDHRFGGAWLHAIDRPVAGCASIETEAEQAAIGEAEYAPGSGRAGALKGCPKVLSKAIFATSGQPDERAAAFGSSE